MRGFLAIPLPDAMRETLAEVGLEITKLRSQRADTIHLTLRFLGEVEDPDAVAAAIAPVVAKHRPFDMSLERVGVFPQEGAARVVWVGLGDGEMQAGAIVAGIENALEPLGFPREHRAWHGHVTLGRFRHPEDAPPGLVDRKRRFGSVRATRVVLYESIQGDERVIHRAVGDFPLGQ